jgi:LPPG:FO 2-phospho-L-lactate transferase
LGKKVTVLCGGSGSSKFASAISSYATDAVEPKFIANVADNFWWNGLLVCPDVDIITYALSGILEKEKGWGVHGDSFVNIESLSVLRKSEEWFSLGDRDLATCLKRTQLYKAGWSLSSITQDISSKLGAKNTVVPATDDFVQTFVRTQEGDLHLQEYWVKNRGQLKALGVKYQGIESATPSEQLMNAGDQPVLVCPANPVTSILPTVQLKRVSDGLKKAKVIAISPFVGEKPFSGPAGDLMHSIGVEANSRGVAVLYSNFLKIILLDNAEDPEVTNSINDMGIEAIRTVTRVQSEEDKKRMAEELTSLF